MAGFYDYRLSRYRNAYENFQKAARSARQSSNKIFMQLYTAAVQIRRGRPDAARKIIETLNASSNKTALGKIISFLTGTLPSQSFLGPEGPMTPQRCMKEFFWGLRAELENDSTAALAHYQSAMATKQKTCVAYHLSHANAKVLNLRQVQPGGA